MIVKLIKPLPLRLKKPIINNVISRTKYKLIGIYSESNGLSLPFNDVSLEYLKISNYNNFILKNRLLVYNINDKYLLGFDFYQNIVSWSNQEINYLTEIINDEINMII
jgi:hypothetical protein